MALPFGTLGTAVLASLGRTSAITVERYAVGSYAGGVFVPGAVTSTPTTAHVQPAGARDQRDLPEGERNEEAIAIFTEAALRVSSGLQAADVVIWRAVRWKVSKVYDWTEQARYAKAIAVKIGVA